MKKNTSLLDAVNRAIPDRYDDKPSEKIENKRVEKKKNTSREGKKLIAGHFDAKVAKQLKMLSVEEETTVQELLSEALDLLFVKKGMSLIKDLNGE